MNQTIEKILQIKAEGTKFAGNFDYGANVIPVIKYYLSITDYDKRKDFMVAIEEMLTSKDSDLREYAVTLCLGFITFRDTV